MRTLLLMLTALLIVAACKPGEPVVALQVQPLIGTWRLVLPDSTYGVTLRLAVDPNNPPVDITPFDAGGQSGVNTYSARLFAAADGKASVDRLSNTKLAGSPQAMQVEQTYLTNLRAVVRFQVDAPDQLRLDYGGAQPGTLMYKKID